MHVIDKVHSEKVAWLELINNGNKIVTLGSDHLIKVTDLRTLKVISTIEHKDLLIHRDFCRFSISPNERFILIGGQNGQIFIFNLKSF